MKITYKVGDVRSPEEKAPFVIPHCVNDAVGGIMGSGVARALFEKWDDVKGAYHMWAEGTFGLDLGFDDYISGPYRLGEVQILEVESVDPDKIYVANMVGQRDVCDFHGIPPVRYEAIRDCLLNLRTWLDKKKTIKNICAPKFCSDLAGGDWSIVEGIIKTVFEKTNYNWVIYTLPPQKPIRGLRANLVICDDF